MTRSLIAAVLLAGALISPAFAQQIPPQPASPPYAPVTLNEQTYANLMDYAQKNLIYVQAAPIVGLLQSLEQEAQQRAVASAMPKPAEPNATISPVKPAPK